MPISNRTYRDPVRPAAGVQVSPMNRAWPAAIVLAALVVFMVFLAQTTLLLALAMTLATLVAGGILLTLMFGTIWITQLRHLITDLWR